MLFIHWLNRSIRHMGCCALTAALLTSAGLTAPAHAITLTDGNSSATIDPDNAANQTSWNVDGVNQLFAQQFFYRIGNSGPEANVNTLVKMNQLSNANTLAVQYGVNDQFSFFTITFNYALNGGANGSGASDMLIDVFVDSNTEVPLDFHLWQYTDMDLAGTINDTMLSMAGSPVINTVCQTDGPITLGETVITSIPTGSTHHQVDFFPVILNLLNDANPTTLNDSNGPIGPGDLSWALQWDFNLDPGDQFTISEDLRIQSSPNAVPSPTAAVFGLFGLAAFRRRRR